MPECAFSVLVVMPAPPPPPHPPHRDDSDDDEPILPDIMLGTTHLQPTIPLAEAGIKGDDESDKQEFEYVVNELDLIRARSRQREMHWATVWGLDVGGRM